MFAFGVDAFLHGRDARGVFLVGENQDLSGPSVSAHGFGLLGKLRQQFATTFCINDVFYISQPNRSINDRNMLDFRMAFSLAPSTMNPSFTTATHLQGYSSTMPRRVSWS
jgi:hypothetical protein